MTNEGSGVSYEEKGKKTRIFNAPRKVRPEFAEDVYGSPRGENSESSAVPKNNETDGLSGGDQVNSSTQGSFARRMGNERITLMIGRNDRFERGGLSSGIGGCGSSTDFKDRQCMDDLDFQYANCDTHAVELSELYPYSEMEDFSTNFDEYTRYVENRDESERIWRKIPIKSKQTIMQDLTQRLENADPAVRLSAARVLLFILQGAYGDFSTDEEFNQSNEQQPKRPTSPSSSNSSEGTGGFEKTCILNGAVNAYFIYESGLYQSLCTMLAVEKQDSTRRMTAKQALANTSGLSNGSIAGAGSGSCGSNSSTTNYRRCAANISDNESLRVILNCLYHMVESIRREELIESIVSHTSNPDSDQHIIYTANELRTLRNNFINELDEPLETSKTPLVIFLFDMMSGFVLGKAIHFPIKKVLILTWKILLATLGGLEVLREEKSRRRAKACLSSIEDTITVANLLKPSDYGQQFEPVSDLGRKADGPQRKINGVEGEVDTNAANSSNANNTPTFDDDLFDEIERRYQQYLEAETDADSSSDTSTVEPTEDKEESLEAKDKSKDEGEKATEGFYPKNEEEAEATSANGDQTPRAGSPTKLLSTAVFHKHLPWKTKVRERDLEEFLQKQRQKHFGYKLPAGDSQTLFGLQTPIIESVKAFRRNIYVSLSDLELKADDEYNKYPFSKIEFVEETRTERLYRRMLPNMTEYVYALIKVILAMLQSPKGKGDALSILCDVLTPDTDTHDMLSNSMSLDMSGQNVLEETVRFAIDVNRHKELVVKATSSIILLLLKFFRLNHVYQFENFAQSLVLGHCLILCYKFMDQNIVRYVQSKYEITPLNYPSCALYYVRNQGQWPPLNEHNVYTQDYPSYYMWRNLYSATNILRIWNKLTKWKPARTSMLVGFKSAPVLKRCLRVRSSVFQLYVLKLLKMQARFLGRQWRKTNMDVISAIYTKVRHRLNDDWAFANDTRYTKTDHQVEEAELAAAIKRFNTRRYRHILGKSTTASDISEARMDANGYATADSPPPIPHPQHQQNVGSQQLQQQSSPRAAVAKSTGNNNGINAESDQQRQQYMMTMLLNEIDSTANGGSSGFCLTVDELAAPVDNSLQSLLSWQPQFSDRFCRNYERWVDEEVINRQVDWDRLLESTRGIAFQEEGDGGGCDGLLSSVDEWKKIGVDLFSNGGWEAMVEELI